ncbi:MAG: hypothetical protein ACXQS8_08380 [Candidatus Helarchaeales archaeon]
MKQGLVDLWRLCYDLLFSPREGFRKLHSRPVHWCVSLLIGWSIFILNAFLLLQVPSILTWAFVHDLVTNEFYVLSIAIWFLLASIIYFLLIGCLFLVNVLRRKIEKKSKVEGERTKLLAFYNFSLLPFAFFLTQLPFIFLQGGHYVLFGLFPFYIILWLALMGWHVFLFFSSIRVVLSLRCALVYTGILIASIAGILLFLAVFVNWSNWSIWIFGFLFG